VNDFYKLLLQAIVGQPNYKNIGCHAPFMEMDSIAPHNLFSLQRWLSHKQSL